MSVWHGGIRKKKPSGGRRISYRKKRRFELGSFPAETTLGETKRKTARGEGGTQKLKILSDKQVCVTDPKTGKTTKVEITRVAKNPANIDYNRRGVITKGAVVETSMGLARITSRPGQHGMLNAILIGEEKS
ncbi:MAG TPA: 30S ribosomal protein S8e [Candidatus Bathyarchaeia archaeon]|nr:30S ribosomal protein S8e [Candidatus Bathyarchaeia archaeon]